MKFFGKKEMYYFVRHGQTEYSEINGKIYQGFGVNLSPLSDEGIRQIENTAKDERLSGADIIISSPYTRALQSAAIISKVTSVPLVVETDLHEWLANKNYVYESDETAKKAYLEYEANHGRYPENEQRLWEDADTIKKRVVRVLKKYSRYDKVIVVCHGTMIAATTGEKRPDNGQIVEFELPVGR